MRPNHLALCCSPIRGGASVGDMSGGDYLAVAGAVLLIPAIGATIGYFLGKPSGHPVAGALGGAVAIVALDALYASTHPHI